VFAAAVPALHVCLHLAAPPEGSLEQQWPQLDGAADVLALAPDDEILGELLALQVGQQGAPAAAAAAAAAAGSSRDVAAQLRRTMLLCLLAWATGGHSAHLLCSHMVPVTACLLRAKVQRACSFPRPLPCSLPLRSAHQSWSWLLLIAAWLQGELLQQMSINRARLGVVLQVGACADTCRIESAAVHAVLPCVDCSPSYALTATFIYRDACELQQGIVCLSALNTSMLLGARCSAHT
jgi:hypothetical protein